MDVELELLIKSQGGVFDLTGAQGEMGAFLRHVLQDYSQILQIWIHEGPLAETEPLRNTKFHLLSSRSPACFVSANGEGYFIGLSAGFPVILLDTFLAVMACPTFFGHIGEAGQEAEWQSGPQAERFRVGLPLDAFPSDDVRTAGFWKVPQDIKRIRFAFDLCYDALEFLLYHELAHLYRGHLDLHEKLLGYSTIMETEENPPTHDIHKEDGFSVIEMSQFMEMDADRCASECLLYPAIPESQAAAISEEKKHELNRRLFAVMVLFLLQFKSKPLEHFHKARYPHPRVRHALVLAWTMTAIFGERNISVERATLELEPFLTNLKHFSDIFGPCIPLLDSNRKEAIDQATEERLSFYERMQNLIFPTLDETRSRWATHLPATLLEET